MMEMTGDLTLLGKVGMHLQFFRMLRRCAMNMLRFVSASVSLVELKYARLVLSSENTKGMMFSKRIKLWRRSKLELKCLWTATKFLTFSVPFCLTHQP